jgi:hypothetical protein
MVNWHLSYYEYITRDYWRNFKEMSNVAKSQDFLTVLLVACAGVRVSRNESAIQSMSIISVIHDLYPEMIFNCFPFKSLFSH